MKISKKPTSVTLTFSPDEYWLRKNKNNSDFYGEYCLTSRIDMSYAGKVDQEGSLIIYLSEEQAKIFREAGFSEIGGGANPSLTPN